MHKVIAISNHGTMLGGGEFSFLDLVARIKDSWNILIVVPEEGELASRLREKTLRTTVIPLPPLRPWLVHKILNALVVYIRICLKFHPDLIYANGSRAALYAGITGRILRIPVIWHCRIAARDTFLDPILSRLCTLIVANSRASAKRFDAKLQQKIRIVYNAVDHAWLTDNSVREPKMIAKGWKILLVVARISRDKRHDVILSAFERTAVYDTSAHLVCVGSKDPIDEGWWEYIKEKTDESPFVGRIHWIGQADDIRPWYRVAYLLALASENESFGRVLVEAMCSGVPVIATRVGAIPEIIREDEDGILVKSGSVNEMSRAMLKLLSDDALRKHLSESARKRCKQFSLEVHVNQMLDVFEETLRSHAIHMAR